MTLELIEGKPIPPDLVLCSILLGACKVHGLLELGTCIGNLEPEHDGH